MEITKIENDDVSEIEITYCNKSYKLAQNRNINGEQYLELNEE